ncbi:histidine phosphatase family protein [Tritonibacter horizontis]|uniref:Glucosyl-3-phosphoglycerate phosphatase n=1 Tax=Tritonibacter horizontis TaxID=1768241 RepID=A0A132BV52_9RHOB|nr:histidine phosphatase family protein [Tritonibacter horizontis]KUP92265.1 glucosyl-3-phosphoglycerate phosphatase [Tritonibacter horizontis]
MNDFPKIWFLRHGETEWNAEGRIQGQMESDLTERGIAQAHHQAELVRPILQREAPPCLVSPLRRAQQTAKIALGGAAFDTDPRLAEVQAGVFQGLTRAEIAATYPEIHARAQTNLDLFCAAPEGEGYATFHARVLTLLQALKAPTLIVAHGLWGQVMRGIICGLDYDELADLPNEQGCVYRLENGCETALR